MTTKWSPGLWLRLVLSLGIVALVASMPLTAVAQTGGPSAAIHIVSWGETVGTIAADYGVSATQIISANNLDKPDRLYAGQQLVIPGAGPSPAPAAQSSGTHVVQRGEGLYRIALSYGLTVADLMAANGISNPDAIYAGQVLVIPSPGYANSAPGTGGPQSVSSSIHIVQPGEILSRISQRYGVSVTSIVAANNLLNANSIYSGQRLVIPGSGTPANNAPPPAAQTPVASTHVVQPGETLGLIATRYGVSVTSLVQANAIRNPSLLYSGQQLVIPGGGTNSGPAAQLPPQQSNPGSHAVQQGETLFRIAVRYGISVDALRAANGISGNTIYTGQVLTIPGGSGNPAPAPDPAVNAPEPTLATGKQIIVKLSEQKVYAYENGQLLRHFVVSTGLPATPTVQGDFSIYVKYDSQWMTGPGYSLPGVPWVMYFYQGYGLHGTYWHNNFGQPMSHGCVNMRTAEAEWLYAWAPIGTPVRVIW